MPTPHPADLVGLAIACLVIGPVLFAASHCAARTNDGAVLLRLAAAGCAAVLIVALTLAWVESAEDHDAADTEVIASR